MSRERTRISLRIPLRSPRPIIQWYGVPHKPTNWQNP